MIVYRLCNQAYSDDLSGTGAKLYGGRWNPIGLNALYTTENISLAVLELLVHIKAYRRPQDYYLLSISIPENIQNVFVDHTKLKKSWKDDPSYSQFMGGEFLRANESAVMKVPSAIVDEECNYIINPLHSDSSRIRIVSTRAFYFDKRLHLTNA
jgi:RES domain-containing protein